VHGASLLRQSPATRLAGAAIKSIAHVDVAALSKECSSYRPVSLSKACDDPVMVEHEVRDLFNRRALNWEAKYAIDGPLRPRLKRFADSVSRDVEPGASILDLGCGTGALSRRLAAMGYMVTACDIAEQMIEEGIKASASAAICWRLLQPSWTRLPFEPNAFDAIVASSVFEYVPSISDVLEECRRILKPGGRLIFSVPNPSHYVRHVESVLRPLAVGMLQFRMVTLAPRMAGYLSYLKSSRNRMVAARWRQSAEHSGLKAETNWLEAGAPLMLIRFTKS
jgi:2-polyprenyl-3-methyl-5-hydroxy-6-metoxy-1,4-benzoquinol methylase